jgi:hypothetical protein
MSREFTLDIIYNITSIKLNDEQLNMALTIASIFHDVWRQSLGKKNGSKYSDEPFYVNNSFNIKTNVNVPYSELPKDFSDINYHMIIFTLKMFANIRPERDACYYLINEYRRIINTSERGSSKDVIFNLLPEKEKNKCIDIFNTCNAFKTRRSLTFEQY